MRRSNSLQGVCKVSVAAALAVAMPISALAAPTSAQICESGKNKTANSYVDCLSKAQAKLVYGYVDGRRARRGRRGMRRQIRCVVDQAGNRRGRHVPEQR